MSFAPSKRRLVRRMRRYARHRGRRWSRFVDKTVEFARLPYQPEAPARAALAGASGWYFLAFLLLLVPFQAHHLARDPFAFQQRSQVLRLAARQVVRQTRRQLVENLLRLFRVQLLPGAELLG